MDQSLLSPEGIIGLYYLRLQTSPGLQWVNGVSNMFNSTQEVETYPFIGMSPAMREWIGGRQPKGFEGHQIEVRNKHFEATIEFRLRDVRRDKTPQIQARINDLADRTLTHWASLLSTLIINGESSESYDGQFFFDTDHQEGSSGVQSNDITVDISALPAEVHGTPTAPSVEEAQQVILNGISQIMSFKDDQGEPMNEMANSFVVKVPTALFPVFNAAVNGVSTMQNQRNLNPDVISDFNVSVAHNARLDGSWTDKVGVFRTDAPTRALIRQEETGVDFKAKAAGSEFEFDNDSWQFGVDTWREVAYGFWQRSCLVQMV